VIDSLVAEGGGTKRFVSKQTYHVLSHETAGHPLGHTSAVEN